MNQNTAGAVLVLILAAAGLVQDQPAVWALAAVTAALAFVCHEVGLLYDFSGRPLFWGLRNALALASWATVALAFILAL